MTNSTETICLLEPPGQDQKDTKLSYSSSTPSEPLKSDSISETIANAPINRYHVITMVTVFAGYCGRNALLDMTPVLSTRLFVEMNLTPEMESALATVTFIGMTISYLFTGWIANKFGRKVCVVWGTIWTFFWNARGALAWNIESIIAFRAFWSLSACELTVVIYLAFRSNFC